MFKVINAKTNREMGCFPTYEKALEHLHLLYSEDRYHYGDFDSKYCIKENFQTEIILECKDLYDKNF